MAIANLGLRVDPSGASAGLTQVEKHLQTTAAAAFKVENALKSTSTSMRAAASTMTATAAATEKVGASWTQMEQKANAAAAGVEGAAKSAGISQQVLSKLADEAFARISANVKTAGADFKAGIISIDQYTEALKLAQVNAMQYRETLASLSKQQASQFNSIMVTTGKELEAVAAKGIEVEGAFKKMRQPMLAVAASAVGMNTKVGEAIATLAMLGIGSGPMLLLLAGLSAVAYAIDKIGEKSREHKKELEDFNRQLDEAAQQRVYQQDPQQKFKDDLDKIAEEQQTLMKRRDELKQSLDEAKRVLATNWEEQIVAALFPAATQAAHLTRLLQENQSELDKLGPRIAEIGQQLKDNLENTDAAQQHEAIEQSIADFKLQAATIGMTERQAALYELRMKGASAAELATADASLRVIEAFKKQAEAQRQAEEEARRHKEELERLQQQETQEETDFNMKRLSRLQEFLNRGQEIDIQIATLGFQDPEDVAAYRLQFENLTDAERQYLAAKLEQLKIARKSMDAMEAEKEKAKEFTQAWDSAWTQEGNVLAEFLSQLGTGEETITEFARRVVQVWIQMLAQMEAAQAAADVKSFFGKLLGIGVQAAGSAFTYNGVYVPAAPNVPTFNPQTMLPSSISHAGGRVGSGPSRIVPADLFTGARRYHDGGPVLAPGEVPIIARAGETVMTPEQLSQTTGNFRQEVHFHFSQLDTRGMAELLQREKPTIAAIVAEAAQQSSAFSRALAGRR